MSLDYNHEFTTKDIDQLIDELNNKQITNEQLMTKYNVRCIFVSGKNIRNDLLDTVCRRRDNELIHFFWKKLVDGDQFENLINLSADEIIGTDSYLFVLNYFLLFGDDYKQELINYLKRVYSMLNRAGDFSNIIELQLTANVLLILEAN